MSLPIEIRDSPVWTQAQGLRGVCGLPIRIASGGLLNVCSHPNAEELALTPEGPFRKLPIGAALFGYALFWANYVIDLIRRGAYDGYGADCSGLVCCGAKRAGYNWHTGGLAGGWKYNCSGLMNVSYEISLADLQPGHIFLRTGEHPHVVSVFSVQRDEAGNATSVNIIHADGSIGAGARVRADQTWSANDWATYTPRALQYTPN